jgi:hypothetical protein
MLRLDMICRAEGLVADLPFRIVLPDCAFVDNQHRELRACIVSHNKVLHRAGRQSPGAIQGPL